jgi:uncharacterized LabA/DUF88 family protein
VKTENVIVYIDGYNLYYGLREKGWKWAYWLNLEKLACELLKPWQKLVAVKYFTSVVTQPPDRHRRQSIFLEALQTLPKVQIFYGHFVSDTVECRRCGHSYQTHHEKMTDVNIAVELLTDCFENNLDVALLVSADSDLVGVIEKGRRIFGKRMVVVFPPGRNANRLKNSAFAYLHISRNILIRSLFPDEVIKPDGFILRRPTEWR